MTARLLSAAALLCGLAAGAAHAQQAAPAVEPPAGATRVAGSPSYPAAPAAQPTAAPEVQVQTPAAVPGAAPEAAPPPPVAAAVPPAAIATPAPRGPVQTMPDSAVGSSAGNLLQTIFALLVVLGLLAGLAWFLKRYGPKTAGGSTSLRTVGALSLGGRERIIVVEVGEQWIVVGASPGRVNALATMPRQHASETAALLQPDTTPAGSFSEWLKQTIDKRNAR